MKYEYFHINDFVTDTFFQQWVLTPDEYSSAFWEQWVNDHPEKKEIIQEARTLVKSLQGQRKHYREEDFHTVKQNIKSQLFKDQKSEEKEYKLPPKSGKNHWLKLVALVSGIVLLSIYLLQNWLPEAETFSTGNAEQRTITLPDGSQVILNANTQLKVSARWEEEREVWLEGEAFFEVEQVKQETHQDNLYKKFTVHAAEIDVEVLGTSFNVLDRRGVTLVVLEEGVVELKKKQGDDVGVKMQPGELVSYSNQQQSFKREKANVRLDLGWKEGKHNFEATPLHVIGLVIEDSYGLKVNIDDEAVGKRRFSASVPYGELDVLLNLISESMQVKVTRKKGVIYIKDIF